MTESLELMFFCNFCAVCRPLVLESLHLDEPSQHQYLALNALTSSSWQSRSLRLELQENTVKGDTQCHCINTTSRGTSASSLKASALTVLSAGDLGQDPKGPGLSGAGPWAPVLRVLGDPLPAGICVSRHVVEMDVGVHDVFPRDSVGDNSGP